MNIFQIPNIEQEQSSVNAKIIALIDASGSMQSSWGHLQKQWNCQIANKSEYDLQKIFFDTDTKHIMDNKEIGTLNESGGGCTNIIKAITKLQEVINTYDESQPVTVIFISDGGHNRGGNLTEYLDSLEPIKNRLINFLCIGV